MPTKREKIVVSIKASAETGKKRVKIVQGENKIRLSASQARSLATVITRKLGKSVLFQ